MKSGEWSAELTEGTGWEIDRIGEAQGYDPLCVLRHPVNCSVNGPSTPAMSTLWHPSPEELELLNAGQPVVVRLIGHEHPPIAVLVPAPPAEETPGANEAADIRFWRHGATGKKLRSAPSPGAGWSEITVEEFYSAHEPGSA